MKLAYPLHFEPIAGGGFTVQGGAPLNGVLTEGATLNEAKAMAREALTAVLMAMLDDGDPIPRPLGAENVDVLWIEPDPQVSAPILLRWAREDAGVTQVNMAQRLGIKQQSYQQLERPGNPSIKTLARAFKALSRDLSLSI